MISAQNLCKSYGKIIALDDVSLEVGAGKITGILGPNGAGKTTLFKILCRLVTPDSGEFNIDSPKKKAIGAIIEKPALFEYLNAAQNLKVLSRMLGIGLNRKEIDRQLLEVGIPANRKDPVKNFSLGMRQRLGIAIALLSDPDCLILDEPFLGLDPLGMQSLQKLIHKLAQNQGLAILVSSHLLEELANTCDELIVLKGGRIIQQDMASDLISSNLASWIIKGKNLQSSKVLHQYNGRITGQIAKVDIPADQAATLLQSLALEGIEMTFFGAEKDISKIYGAE